MGAIKIAHKGPQNYQVDVQALGFVSCTLPLFSH